MGNTLLVLEDKPGVSVEMINMLAELIDGLEIKLERCPWKRCLHALKNNTVHGVFNASYKETRLAMGWYPTTNGAIDGPVDQSKRITLISYYFYTLKNSTFKWDGQKIKNVKRSIIGAPAGYSIVTDLQKKGMIVDESPSTKTNLERLLLKRVDAVAVQDVTADTILVSDPRLFKTIEKIRPPIATKPYYLMLSHEFVEEHPKLAEQIWETIKVIRETKFDEIALKYADTN
jgi:polar amino acid transport system substrate-binding protein